MQEVWQHVAVKDHQRLELACRLSVTKLPVYQLADFLSQPLQMLSFSLSTAIHTVPLMRYFWKSTDMRSATRSHSIPRVGRFRSLFKARKRNHIESLYGRVRPVMYWLKQQLIWHRTGARLLHSFRLRRLTKRSSAPSCLLLDPFR